MIRSLRRPALIALAIWSVPAAAQEYPSRPIRIMIGFPPVGAADLTARSIGQKLTDAWHVQVLIENRPGAGGNIAPDLVSKAAPDGYTLLMAAATTHAVSRGLYSRLNYDLEKDLAPVTLCSNIPHVLVAHPALPVRTVKDVIALGKSHPGEINFASQGAGTLSHLEQELLKTMGGFKAVHVPYKGSVPALSDLIPGNVQLLFDSIPSSLPHIKAGKLRGIAVASSQRSPVLPELPTIGESLKGFEADNWFGLMAPAGTPRAVIDKLNAEVGRILAMADIKERLLSQGGVAYPSTPERMAAAIKSDIAKWGKVIAASGAKLE